MMVTQNPAPAFVTRPLYWSVQRELWENRSIYVAPLAAGCLMLLGFLLTLRHLPRTVHGSLDFDLRQQAIELAMPYTHAGWLLMATALIVGLVYSLDALYGERRDRSILFWKSLPVSDLTTVLAKVCIPLLVLPVVVFVLTLIVQFVMLLLSSVFLAVHGGGAATLWTRVPWLQMEVVFLYQLVVMALWLAPVYGWLLLVSGWARRTAFLWAVLPPLGVCILEKITLGSSYGWSLVKDRIAGFASVAFRWTTPEGDLINPHLIGLAQLTPGRFLTSAGLWLGLLMTAALLAAAIRLRRYRTPL